MRKVFNYSFLILAAASITLAVVMPRDVNNAMTALEGAVDDFIVEKTIPGAQAGVTLDRFIVDGDAPDAPKPTPTPTIYSKISGGDSGTAHGFIGIRVTPTPCPAPISPAAIEVPDTYNATLPQTNGNSWSYPVEIVNNATQEALEKDRAVEGLGKMPPKMPASTCGIKNVDYTISVGEGKANDNEGIARAGRVTRITFSAGGRPWLITFEVPKEAADVSQE